MAKKNITSSKRANVYKNRQLLKDNNEYLRQLVESYKVQELQVFASVSLKHLIDGIRDAAPEAGAGAQLQSEGSSQNPSPSRKSMSPRPGPRSPAPAVQPKPKVGKEKTLKSKSEAPNYSTSYYIEGPAGF